MGVSDTPAVGVYVKTTNVVRLVANQQLLAYDVIVHGLVRPDPHRWVGLALSQIAAMVLADIEKALDALGAWGIGAILTSRTTELDIDMSKDLAVFTVVESIEFKTPCV